MFKTVLAVVCGGVLGTLLRYAASLWAGAHFPQRAYLATLALNILGCLVIGYLHGLFLLRPELPDALRLGLMLGLLGALTTFSSFSLDTLRLLEAGQFLIALTYLLVSVCGGLLAAWGGLLLSRL